MSKTVKHVFGIDLGTTNSAISVYIGKGNSQIIQLEKGTTLPSCVMYKDGEFIIGHEAYENRFKSNVCYSVKRLMGTDTIVRLSDKDKDGNNHTVELTPEEVSSLILKELVRQASKYYSDIKDVTITVPAGFNQLQREATRKAGELAGLNVVAIINEPTSASLSYNTKESKKVLVYDLGGGTFDVSIVDIEVDEDTVGASFGLLGVDLGSDVYKAPTYKILANANDNHLGGDDIDKEFFTRAMSKASVQARLAGKGGKVHKRLSDETIEYIRLNIEKGKKMLSTTTVGFLTIPVREEDSELDGIEINAGIGDLTDATRVVYNRTKVLTNKAIVESKIDRSEIKEIVLVGGSTKSNIIKEFLRLDFPQCFINDTINPDECVAVGASVQTAVTSGISETKIFDVVPQTISVEVISSAMNGDVVKGKLVPLIKKNQTLPASNSRTFTLENTHNNIIVKLYQGDGAFVNEADFIGHVVLERDNKDSDTVQLNCLINSNGLLEVTAGSGDFKVKKDLVNIFGIDKGQETKRAKSPRTKLRNMWERNLLQSRGGKALPPTMIAALDSFEETGDEKAKAKIQKALQKARGEVDKEDIIKKTSLFKSDEE